MNRLKTLRSRSGITLRDLARYVDIPSATISLIENGKQPLREIHVQKLTSFFDVTSDYLLGFSNTGIGIYFESSKDDNDHVMISASELERIQERYEIKETLIHRTPSDWTIKTQTYETRIIRTEYLLFRSVDVPKELAHLSESVRDNINSELDKLDGKDLEKVLKFIRDYIK